MDDNNCKNDESLLTGLELTEDIQVAFKKFLQSLHLRELDNVEDITTIAIFQNEKINLLRFPNTIQEPVTFKLLPAVAISTTYEPGHEDGLCWAYKVTRYSNGLVTKIKYKPAPQGEYVPPTRPFINYFSVGKKDGKCCIFIEDVIDNGGAGVQLINKRPWKIE